MKKTRANVVKSLRVLNNLLSTMGINLRKTLSFMRGMPMFLRDYLVFSRQTKRANSPFRVAGLYPCLNDRSAQSGSTKDHYFYQDLLVASRVFLNSPYLHLDVGSRIDGFVAHVASFRSIEVLDIRPLDSDIENIRYVQADLMSSLDSSLVAYCDSLSCLHALEHFGLGRYGDPLDVDGYKKGLENLALIVRPGGKFYLSLPIGPQRVEFNAHRVFSIQHVLEITSQHFSLDSLSVIDDRGQLLRNVDIRSSETERNFGCHYGCGIFEMTRR